MVTTSYVSLQNSVKTLPVLHGTINIRNWDLKCVCVLTQAVETHPDPTTMHSIKHTCNLVSRMETAIHYPNTYMHFSSHTEAVNASYLNRSDHHCVYTQCSGKPKITEFYSSSFANQDVLRLHIAMQDTVGVKVEQRGHQLTSNPLDLHT